LKRFTTFCLCVYCGLSCKFQRSLSLVIYAISILLMACLYDAVLKVYCEKVSVLKHQRRLYQGAEAQHRRCKNRGTAGAEGAGCREGVIWIFDIKTAGFSALCWYYLPFRCPFYSQKWCFWSSKTNIFDQNITQLTYLFNRYKKTNSRCLYLQWRHKM